MKSSTQFGIDIFLRQASSYAGKRLGLVCNQASVSSSGIHSRLALKEAGFQLTRLFAPEHGFDAQGEDGAFIDHQLDAQTQVPIVSLYSEQLAPTAENLADIDLLLIDLPDIGARFYTYLWTMTHVMESAEKFGIPLLILDRPNPMASDLSLAEGPALDPSCSSFIGRFNIPVTHHCSFGELAQYFKAQYFPNLNLSVIAMEHWSRKENSGYTFFPSSPAIQRRETVYTYPGACLFEGLNIQEGRGTDYPFAQFGAPWIDGQKLLQAAQEELSGASLEAVTYTSTMSIYQGQRCEGLRVQPENPRTFQSFAYFIQLIQLIHRLFPGELQERNYLTNVNPSGAQHLDLLTGVPNAFARLKEHTLDSKQGVADWAQRMQPYLYY